MDRKRPRPILVDRDLSELAHFKTRSRLTPTTATTPSVSVFGPDHLRITFSTPTFGSFASPLSSAFSGSFVCSDRGWHQQQQQWFLAPSTPRTVSLEKPISEPVSQAQVHTPKLPTPDESPAKREDVQSDPQDQIDKSLPEPVQPPFRALPKVPLFGSPSQSKIVVTINPAQFSNQYSQDDFRSDIMVDGSTYSVVIDPNMEAPLSIDRQDITNEQHDRPHFILPPPISFQPPLHYSKLASIPELHSLSPQSPNDSQSARPIQNQVHSLQSQSPDSSPQNSQNLIQNPKDVQTSQKPLEPAEPVETAELVVSKDLMEPIVPRLKSVDGMWEKCLKSKKGLYSCPHCDSKHKNLAQLAYHMDRFDLHRPFACTHYDCPWRFIGFSKRTEWRRHTEHQHAAKTRPFVCPHEMCSKSFSRRDSMKRHFECVHLNLASRMNRKLQSSG